MLISIIIPVYKVEQYLRECVDSVLTQTYRNLEVILVDDGSPDGCPAICDEYVENDSRVKVIHKKNGGLSDARNVGIEMATGEYVVCLDSDDFWIGTDVLEKVVKELEYHPDILFFDRVTFCMNGQTIYPKDMQLSSINGKNRAEALTMLMQGGKFIVSACNKFLKTTLLKEHHVAFKKGIVSEDIDWTYQMMPYVQTMRGFDIPFYGYRRREGSITNSIGRKNLDDLLSIIEHWSKDIQVKESDLQVKYQLLGYLNYQTFIVMGLLQRLPTSEHKEFEQRIEKLSFLLQYDVNKKTHLASIGHQILGKKVYKVLAFYISIKNKGWKIA